MAPLLRLLLLPLLTSIAAGLELKDKTGPFESTQLVVEELTKVPHLLHQFQVTNADITGFKLSGEGREDLRISSDGWLYLDRPLDWSKEDNYILTIEALAGSEVVGEPITVTIDVLDINNHAPAFEHNVYTATIREYSKPGVQLTQVSAYDRDDPETPNAQLTYSLGDQIPNKHNTPLFQIDAQSGWISITEEGARLIKAREGFALRRGEEEHDTAFLKRMFNDYCPVRTISHEENPFFTCMERAEMRRRNVDPLTDPDYTLIVRVQDMAGTSENPLMGSTTVHIVVEQNLWVNPGPIIVRENLQDTYPMVIGKVEANELNAIYTLTQKERDIIFPFQINPNGDILLTKELDREEKDHYILVVMAVDSEGQALEDPLEIHVVVEDENDNEPQCAEEDNVFEIQEGELGGSVVGEMTATDADQEGTLNSRLTYTILSQTPPGESPVFSIDGASGTIQALRALERKEHQLYNLMVQVSDAAFSTECRVIIRVIDVNSELPLFEKQDYGTQTLAEDTALEHTVATISATDADDPDSGSSKIEFHISSGNDDEVFRVETDGKGVGYVVIAKPLDFESSRLHKLQIDARNPEPLMKGLEYDEKSTTFVSVEVTDVDEPPQFDTDMQEVSLLENSTVGSVLLTVGATDPEGKEISYKLDGDSRGWLEINAATGEIKTKSKLDREALQTFPITVTAFEKDHPEMLAEHVVTVEILDVNDNKPMLSTNQAFICVKTLDPVIVMAEDLDSEPFSDPFTFTLERQARYPHWKLETVDGKSAKLSLQKAPVKETTFRFPINIKDQAGMGVTQELIVKVCNCTELGYCHTEPDLPGQKLGLAPTVGILVGVLAFCIIAFIVVIRRVKKGNNKGQLGAGEDQRMM